MLLKVLHYPNELLLKKTQEVIKFDDLLQSEIYNMFETMYIKRGIGLAANQVGISKNMFIMDINQNPYTFINPQIVEQSSELQTSHEGCLSFPEMRVDVERFKNITLKWQNVYGEESIKEFFNLESICIQHELEHLSGSVFIKNLNNTKKQIFLQKYSKVKKN